MDPRAFRVQVQMILSLSMMWLSRFELDLGILLPSDNYVNTTFILCVKPNETTVICRHMGMHTHDYLKKKSLVSKNRNNILISPWYYNDQSSLLLVQPQMLSPQEGINMPGCHEHWILIISLYSTMVQKVTHWHTLLQTNQNMCACGY